MMNENEEIEVKEETKMVESEKWMKIKAIGKKLAIGAGVIAVGVVGYILGKGSANQESYETVDSNECESSEDDTEE